MMRSNGKRGPNGPSTAVLTHYGRKTGRPYEIAVWFVEIDGALWVGSLDSCRAWVRNVKATGHATIDVGNGPVPVRCECCEGGPQFERFAEAVRGKYPIRSRLLTWLVRGKRCAFRLLPERAP